MKNVILIFIFVVFLSGCQSLSTLMRYSKEMKAQEREMAIQQKRFNKLKLAIEDNKLVTQMSIEEVKKRYGDPVIIMNEEGLKRWVYKPGVVKVGTEKVYLYFGEDKLIKWKYIQGE